MLCNPVLLPSLCSIYYSKGVSHLSPAWQASMLFGWFYLAGNLVLPCLTEDQPLLVWTVGSLEKQPYNSNQPQHNMRYTLPGKLTYLRADCCCILGESGFDISNGSDPFFYKVAERSSPNTCTCSDLLSSGTGN